MQDWQLEDSAKTSEQWQLLETEQQLPAEMQLQQDSSVQRGDWQPVEYAPPAERSGGGSWLLPALIILALVAAVGYIGWLGLSGFDVGSTGGVIATPASVAQNGSDPGVIVVAPTPTQTATPVPTPAPTATALPTSEPAPTAVRVEQPFATINSPFKLNARAAASVDADVVELLDDGAVYPIIQESADGWINIQLTNGESAWVAAEFVDVSVDLVDAEDAVNIQALAGQTEPATGEASTSLTTGVVPPQPYTDQIPSGPAVIIEDSVGVNARSSIGTDATVLQIVPEGAALAVTGQNAAGDWLQVSLPNGTNGWVSRDAVTTSGDVTLAPVVQESVTAVDEVDTSGDSQEEASPSLEDATVTVDNTIGLNTRRTPDAGADVAVFVRGGTVMPAIGRTADGEWVQVALDDGESAWVFAAAVELSVDLDTLPVSEP